MKKNIKVIPYAPLARILSKTGARVSANGVNAFAEVLMDMADKISKKAVVIAEHSGRKTVTDADVKLAAKQIYIVTLLYGRYIFI